MPVNPTRPNSLPITDRIFAQARPVISSGAVDAVIKFLQEKTQPPLESYVDVACGTGFSTVKFGAHFQTSLGTDSAQSQIDEARKLEAFQHRQLQFKVSDASAIPVEPASVDLVTVIQGAHWLDHPAFNKEVDRVLKPSSGVVALCGYSLPSVSVSCDGVDSERLNAPVVKLHNMLLDGGHWNKERTHVENRYKDIPLPFPDTKVIRDDPSLSLSKQMTVDLFMDYICTWSGLRNYLAANPDAEDVERCRNEILTCLSADCAATTLVTATFPWFVCMARKP